MSWQDSIHGHLFWRLASFPVKLMRRANDHLLVSLLSFVFFVVVFIFVQANIWHLCYVEFKCDNLIEAREGFIQFQCNLPFHVVEWMFQLNVFSQSNRMLLLISLKASFKEQPLKECFGRDSVNKMTPNYNNNVFDFHRRMFLSSYQRGITKNHSNWESDSSIDKRCVTIK